MLKDEPFMTYDGHKIVFLEENLEADKLSQLHNYSSVIERQKTSPLIFDFRNVEYMNISILTKIINIIHQETPPKVQILCKQGDVLDLLKTLHLDRFIEVTIVE